MAHNIIEELDKIKKQIAEAEKNMAIYDGRLQESMQRLKELGLDSVEAAEKEMKSLSEQIVKLDSQIEKDFNELKESYQW
jgi:seryl-tRNA synthetase